MLASAQNLMAVSEPGLNILKDRWTDIMSYSRAASLVEDLSNSVFEGSIILIDDYLNLE